MGYNSPYYSADCYWSIYDEDDSVYMVNIFFTLANILYSINFVLGIPGNGLVIWIAGFKMKTISAVWFLNLAIADFIFCMSIPLLHLSYKELGIFYEVINIILSITMCTSVCFLTAMSIDRCVSVMWPIWSQTHRTHKCIRIISTIIWVVGLILTAPDLFIDDMYRECIINSTYKLKIIRFVGLFVIPFTAILMCYYIIFLKLRTVKRPNRSQRPYKIITAVVICFFICWFPYYISPFLPKSDLPSWAIVLIYQLAENLASFNSCINPILYVFICQDFKENLINSLPPRLRRAINKCSIQTCRGRENDIEATDNMREIRFNVICL
ncbi:formyl peptide receptor-related sequence 1-like [Mixophyes fleayi]|uniref:formyl peptide receptor-related sequence 1-like n=1 Tax=Mixophyes fleayi TaxID=3061075 RepID=UPI003F4D843E